jgi:EAL domain-containing protein (putative c-di-GMP-specific phosphodiesterase class I)
MMSRAVGDGGRERWPMRKKAWTWSGEAPVPSTGSEPPRPPRVRSIPPAALGVAFQPIVDLATRQTFAVEMLARCTAPTYPNPSVLFEQAELQGVTGRLGRMVREVGFEHAPKHALFVNLHPHELSERWVVRPDDPMNFFDHGLYLEITESATLDYFDLCRSAMRELCTRLNAKLVVDDFGAGHSNLLRIAELEPAVVKLDRQLVQDVNRSRAKQVILRHVVALCADLDAKVVAEGIETRDELYAVIDCGVHYGQGYLLARPANPVPDVVWPA